MSFTCILYLVFSEKLNSFLLIVVFDGLPFANKHWHTFWYIYVCVLVEKQMTTSISIGTKLYDCKIRSRSLSPLIIFLEYIFIRFTIIFRTIICLLVVWQLLYRYGKFVYYIECNKSIHKISHLILLQYVKSYK